MSPSLLLIENHMRLRSSLVVKPDFLSLVLLHFSLLVFSFFLTTCTSIQKPVVPAHTFSITDEERVWLREFFHDLLFDDLGAYVLYGTKPMSWSCLEDLPTEEEKARWKSYYESLPPEEKAKYFTKRVYDFKGNFQKWEQIKHRFPIRQYLFGRFSNTTSEKVENLCFVNIEQAVRVLLANYADFRRVLGYDFDPLEAIFDIENRDSKFWNEVLQHHTLIGMLLGFGKDNSWFFEWAIQYENEPSKQGDFFASFHSKFYENRDVVNATKEKFSLPLFRSYGLYPNDKELFDQYKKEQKQIKALYRGRDEVDVALEWLTRCAPQAHK